ncbi:MAG: OmpH family outer membrane protein [Blastocatellia bacterium]
MKLLKATFTLVALLSLTTLAAAQQTAGAQPAALPKGKVAVINTAMFQEQVLEFKAKMDELNRQFEPRVRDVRGLADRITAQENTIKTQGQGGALSAARVAEMTEQLDGMKKEYQRKAEDLEADASRAKDRAFEPLTNKLVKFAQDYTAKRGIVHLIDLSNSTQSGFLLWYDPRADITTDFIAEYNKANPVSAAPAATKP